MAQKNTEPTIEVGQMAVSDYQPTAEDLARLEKNRVPEPPREPDPPETPIEERLSLISGSRSKQTMAEMERGKAIVQAREQDRQRRLAMMGQ